MRHTEFISLQNTFKVGNKAVESESLPAMNLPQNSERGFRPNPDDRMKYMYRLMWVDPKVRQTIIDIRNMDLMDPRVKKIHTKTASVMTKSGLCLEMQSENNKVRNIWNDFIKRLALNKRQKLISDARGYLMEGNLMMQWVLGADNKIFQGIRMPSETMIADVNPNGVFKDPQKAYQQMDVMTGQLVDHFSLWQISHGRLEPANYDDLGSMGRPLLDATRTIWKKLLMTEEDLVIRRRDRAALQKVHVLEGASSEDVQEYKDRVEEERKVNPIQTDYYLNKKGGVESLQGDENLDHIKDILLLVNAFFTGAPAPKAMFGYVDGLNRDVLQDIRNEFFEEVDTLQDELADVYREGFELELLLNGVDPLKQNMTVKFKERVTETRNQAADRALKLQALGVSSQTVWETAGVDPQTEIDRKTEELNSKDPYPEPGNIGNPGVSITPGNAPKRESATSITND